MNGISLSRAVALVALLALPAAALPAFAQTAATAPAPSAAPARPMKTPAENAVLKNQSENVDAHIAKLHSELKITPSEETAWASFAQVMRDNASQMDAAFTQRGSALPTMNAVQDLQSYAQIAQIQSDNMQKLATAFQTLYASFSAPQQQLADAVFRAHKIRK